MKIIFYYNIIKTRINFVISTCSNLIRHFLSNWSYVSNLGKPMLAKKHSSHLSSHLSFNKTSAYSSHHFFKTNKKTNKKIIKRIKGKSFLLYIYKKNGVK